jgi:hypothetical protein
MAAAVESLHQIKVEAVDLENIPMQEMFDTEMQ